MSDLPSTDGAPPAATPGKEFELGVLFVHGIGEQGQADTLLQFGEPLCDWIDSWLYDDPAKAIVGECRFASASLKPPQVSDGTPAHAELRLEFLGRSRRDDQKWLLTESWWSSQVVTPAIREFLGWLVTRGPWVTLLHLHQLAFTPEEPPFLMRLHRRWRFIPATRPPWLVAPLGIVVFSLWFLISLLLAITWTVVSLVALIPIGRLRDAVYSGLRKIAGIVGDSFVWVHEPIQRAAAIEATVKALKWLDARAGKIVVIAHSQGAAVAHRALRQSGTPTVQRFITFGEGLGKLQALMLAEAGTPGTLICAGLAAPLLGIGAIWSIRLWQLDLWAITHAFAPVTVLLVGFICLARAWIDIRQKLSDLHAHGRNWSLRIMQPELTWFDYYGTRDPVPNGALSRSIFLPEVRSRAVNVLGSFLSDHTSYWRSKADFIPLVVRQLDRLSGAGLFAGAPLTAPRWPVVSAARLVDACRLRVLGAARQLDAAALLLPLLVASSRFAAMGANVRSALANSPLSMVAGFMDRVDGALTWLVTTLFASQPGVADAATNVIVALALAFAALVIWQRVYRAMWTWWRDLALEPLFTPSDITIGRGTWDDHALLALFVAIGSVPLIVSGAWVFFPDFLAEVKIYRLLAVLVAAMVTAFMLLVLKSSIQESWMEFVGSLRAGTAFDFWKNSLAPGLITWTIIAAFLTAALGAASSDTLIWYVVASIFVVVAVTVFGGLVRLIRNSATPRRTRAFALFAPAAGFAAGYAWTVWAVGSSTVTYRVGAFVMGLVGAFIATALFKQFGKAK
jgi:hypothetical protein